MTNIISRSMLLFACMLSLLLEAERADASSSGTSESQAAAGVRNEYAVLKYLVPALRQAGKVGRIYYAASCPLDEGYPYYPYPFPKLNVQPPSKDVSGLTAVREMFQDDPSIKIEEQPPGTIKVRIGKISDELLQTHISRVTVKPEDQYDSRSVIDAIKDSDEVRLAMHNLGIHVDSRVNDRGVQMPVPGLPHLSDPLTNETMDQALDFVAQTFRGIVLYGACTKQRYYTIDFTGGPGFDLSYSPP